MSQNLLHMRNYQPVLALYKAKDFDTALDMADQLIKDGGYGHTASLYIHPSQTEKMAQHADRMKACRILVNTPSSHGGIGDLYNFKLAPSLTRAAVPTAATLYPKTWV